MDDDGDCDVDDFDGKTFTEWGLRKCAAAALDVLAVRFGADLLNVLLVPLKTNCGAWIGHTAKAEFSRWGRWLKVRVSMPLLYGFPLRLSSISSGCIDAIEPHLPTSIPYLINVLNDSKVSRMGPFILYYF